MGRFKGVGKVYLHTVVDTFGSYAFGVLGTSKHPDQRRASASQWAVSVLYNDALPFYQEKNITVSAVLTDKGREFCAEATFGGRGMLHTHPFELFPALSHRPGDQRSPQRTKVRSACTNGFVERFHRTVLDEFFRVKLRPTFYQSVEALQCDLDEWLRFYNCERARTWATGT